jgi:hypothetical protein
VALRLSGWLIWLAAAALLSGIANGARCAEKPFIFQDYRLEAGLFYPLTVIARIPGCVFVESASAARAFAPSIPIDPALLRESLPRFRAQQAVALSSLEHRPGWGRFTTYGRSPPSA